jgi:hypothetical protein
MVAVDKGMKYDGWSTKYESMLVLQIVRPLLNAMMRVQSE